MYTHSKQIIVAGKNPKEAGKAMILLHGRGSSAQDILSLGKHLNVDEMAVYAPQATQHSWYPFSFMAPEEQNQPTLNSALDLIGQVVDDILKEGIDKEHIYFAGFSQGACLTLEYTARNAARYGGIIAFTGGLIGRELRPELYKGDFDQTPVFISTGDPDPHVPLSRVEESTAILEGLNARVTKRIYKGRNHTIAPEEIRLVNELILFQK